MNEAIQNTVSHTLSLERSKSTAVPTTEVGPEIPSKNRKQRRAEKKFARIAMKKNRNLGH